VVANSSAHAAGTPAQAIEEMRAMMLPAIQHATEWGLKAGLGLVSMQAFYSVVVRVTKL
jgi:hypothetical protein